MKREHDKLLSNFAFYFNLRPYSVASRAALVDVWRTDPRWLMPEMREWMRSGQGHVLERAWPKIVAGAASAAAATTVIVAGSGSAVAEGATGAEKTGGGGGGGSGSGVSSGSGGEGRTKKRAAESSAGGHGAGGRGGNGAPGNSSSRSMPQTHDGPSKKKPKTNKRALGGAVQVDPGLTPD